MIILPYSTDAPVYYWPSATVGLIIANVLLFFAIYPPDGLAPESPWLLAYGQELRPDQWFGSRFMHGGWLHLLANMMFLWVFGLVVEGKLGPARFLAAYLVIGIGQAAIEQTCMLGYEGLVPGSLGASAAIYGIMAMALIWAPDNEISFFWWMVAGGTADASVLMFGAFFILMDLSLAMLLGGYAGSSILHLMGAALGAPLGLLLLKRRVIDCEGWDVFSRYGGPKKRRQEEEQAEAAAEANRQEKAALRDSQTLVGAEERIAAYLDAGNAPAAAKLYKKMKSVGDGLRLDAPTLHRMVVGLQAGGLWEEIAPLMAELIDLAPQASDPLRVNLAQLCVTKLNRPGRAIDLIKAVETSALDEKQRDAARRVLARAHQMLEEGVVELDDDAW